MCREWIQARNVVIDPEASNLQVIDKVSKSQQSRNLRRGAKGRRSKKPQGVKERPPKRLQPIFHDDNLRDEQPPHLADIHNNISHDF